MIDKLENVEIIHLQPKDKVIAFYDANILNIEDVYSVHHQLQDFFGDRDVLGVVGTKLMFIREEKIEDGEDNFEKHLEALYKNL